MNSRRTAIIACIALIVAVLIAGGLLVAPTPAQAQGLYNTEVTLSSSRNPSQVGQSVTFTALVTVTFNFNRPTSAKPNQTGAVTFFDGTTLLGSTPLNDTTTPASASLTTPSLTAGTHNITAQYTGDGDFQGAAGTSNVVVQVVLAPAATVAPAAPREVPEADTLLLFGGGVSGLATWARWQWSRRKKK